MGSIKTTPLPGVQMKESQAAFLWLNGKMVDEGKMVVEGCIKIRIVYIGKEGIIHHHQEDRPISHLIQIKKHVGWEKEKRVQLNRKGSSIEYAICRFNPRQNKLEISMILQFLLHIPSGEKKGEEFEERTLVTIPLNLPVDGKDSEQVEDQEKVLKTEKPFSLEKSKKPGEQEEIPDKKEQKKSLNAVKTLSQDQLLQNLQVQIKRGICEEMEKILPSLKKEIKEQLEKDENRREAEKREKIVEKSRKQKQRGYRIKDSQLMKS